MLGTRRIRVLLVQSWTRDATPIAASLRADGIDAELTQIDTEPKLNAAVEREAFDVVVLDMSSLRFGGDVVTACLVAHHRSAPIVELAEPGEVGRAVRIALATVTN